MAELEVKNPRIKTLYGKVDNQSVLTFSPTNMANTGENMVTSLVVQLPNEILETFRIYFEFLLPNKTRFISEPLVATSQEIDTIDPKTRQPSTTKVLMVEYLVPAYVTLTAGTVLVNIKATNDSVTIYKSKIATLRVDDSVNSELDDRYFRGDLLDYIANTKIDTFKYERGWLVGYLKIPATGELVEVGRYPMNPLFPNLEAAKEFAISDEATEGQLISVLVDTNPVTSNVFIINPDRTMTKVLTEGNSIYYDSLYQKPKINTSIEPGVLEPNPSEELLDGFKLSKVAKTGRLSDLLNDRNFSTIKTYSIVNSGVISDDLPAVEGEDLLILDHIIFNNPLNSNDKFIIELGNNSYGWRTILSQDDLDITESNTNYIIESVYKYTTSDILRITVQSELTNISIDVVCRHS